MSSATSLVAPIRRAARMRATRSRSAIDDQPSTAHWATSRADSDDSSRYAALGVFSRIGERADHLGVGDHAVAAGLPQHVACERRGALRHA